MTIKEFSNKNSQALFYSTIILFVVAVALFFALISTDGDDNCRMNKFMNDRGGRMMQDGQRRFDGQGYGFKQNPGQNQTGVQSSVNVQVTPNEEQAPSGEVAQ